jgi:uncharacterized protein
MEKIVISGGSGLVGQALIPLLRSAGHEAVALRRPYTAESLKGATIIINLAGENISGGRWTRKRKKAITDSRVNTLNTLRQLLGDGPHTVKTLISASASGYYGTNNTDVTYSESDPSGNDFLAGVCRAWESAADTFEPMGIRVAKVRIGVVLSEKGGALPKLLMPLKFGISVPLGSGNQWLPWIHIDDLARVFLHLVQNPHLSGPFNAVAPNPVTNRQLMKQLASARRRLFIPIGVPPLFLKAILGEMAVVTLEGSRISAQKLLDSGFSFHHETLAGSI